MLLPSINGIFFYSFFPTKTVKASLFVRYFSLNTRNKTHAAGSLLLGEEKSPPDHLGAQLVSSPPPPSLMSSLPPSSPAQAGHTMGVGCVGRCQAMPMGVWEDVTTL